MLEQLAAYKCMLLCDIQILKSSMCIYGRLKTCTMAIVSIVFHITSQFGKKFYICGFICVSHRPHYIVEKEKSFVSILAVVLHLIVRLKYFLLCVNDENARTLPLCDVAGRK